MAWKPNRSDLTFCLAVLFAAGFFLATLLGDHPDGSILGFAGTLLVIWATTKEREDDDEDSV